MTCVVKKWARNNLGQASRAQATCFVSKRESACQSSMMWTSPFSFRVHLNLTLQKLFSLELELKLPNRRGQWILTTPQNLRKKMIRWVWFRVWVVKGSQKNYPPTIQTSTAIHLIEIEKIQIWVLYSQREISTATWCTEAISSIRRVLGEWEKTKV